MLCTDLNISYEGGGGAAFSISRLQEKLIASRQCTYMYIYNVNVFFDNMLIIL